MADAPYGFNERNAGRVAKATRWIETNGIAIGGSGFPARRVGREIIFAQLSGPPNPNGQTNVYTWQQGYFDSTGGWHQFFSGLSGGPPPGATCPAIDPTYGPDLGGRIVPLCRAKGYDGKPCWIILGVDRMSTIKILSNGSQGGTYNGARLSSVVFGRSISTNNPATQISSTQLWGSDPVSADCTVVNLYEVNGIVNWALPASIYVNGLFWARDSGFGNRPLYLIYQKP